MNMTPDLPPLPEPPTARHWVDRGKGFKSSSAYIAFYDERSPNLGWLKMWGAYGDERCHYFEAVPDDATKPTKSEALAAALEAIIAEMREAADACYKASNSESDGFASGYARGRMRGIEAYQKKVEQALADYRA